jgi:hypothetical protein
LGLVFLVEESEEILNQNCSKILLLLYNKDFKELMPCYTSFLLLKPSNEAEEVKVTLGDV